MGVAGRGMDEGWSSDVVVIGGGAGGLTAALVAAERGATVAIVVKSPETVTAPDSPPTATAYAQGGIAAVDPSDPDDSFGAHVHDTVIAGAGCTDPVAAASIIGDGPAAIARLVGWGMRFDGVDSDGIGAGTPHRTREGGHRVARILHAGGDATGARMQEVLERRVADHVASGRIRIRHGAPVRQLATAAGRVVGAWIEPVDVTDRGGEPELLAAPVTILATGGSGQLYSATTNPLGSTGDGLALAMSVGARIADLQFIQFHPTMLFTPGARGRCPLISEAVRGEGGILRDIHGRPVMAGVHPSGDLAPRDVVARAVTEAMARTGADHVLLDTALVDDFAQRFPMIAAAVTGRGLDMRLIPVVPGAHYQCGGVVTDTRARTSVGGLLAVGEVARTGLHGANRLASNSLLEAVVMGIRAGEAVPVGSGAPGGDVGGDLGGGLGEVDPPRSTPVPIADRDWLQDLMSTNAGIVRDGAGLAAAARALDGLTPRIPCSPRELEDAALTAVARAVIAAATADTVSRGAHMRSDAPQSDADAVGSACPDVAVI
ncbi:L-aspartate oxidase [Gordonia jinhuaensis]|uniref:L-aspartate oxidase n=1 Tax=Gordonia jinhuaensis TaxID=1517702 RepID=A0A916WUH8_9ACTN|nr:FAD-binding protein [Gordonia jinhuaensis]GGB35180.1 L-aspartate oxidase [Gordonia jinhuaensis]